MTNLTPEQKIERILAIFADYLNAYDDADSFEEIQISKINKAKQQLLSLIQEEKIKGRINALEELPITEIKESNGRRTNCVLSEEIYKAIEINKFLNQMKGKDK